MESQNFKFIAGLDHLRGFAALIIVFFHGTHFFLYKLQSQLPNIPENWPTSNNPLITLIIEGHSAVGLFFVISGFIFTTRLLNRSFDYKNFYTNRFIRTYPLFIVILSLGLLIYPENISLSSVSQTLLFLSNKISAFNGGQFTYVFWSIAVEWHFYFIFPILIYLLRKYDYIGLLFIIILFELIRFSIYYFKHELRIISYWTLVGRIDQFIIGMLAGKYWIENIKLIKFKKSLIISSIILILLNSFIFNAIRGATSNHAIWIIWPTLEALSWALFLICYLNIANQLNIFIKDLFNYLGRISYSIYMVHFIVIFYFIEYNFLFKFFNIDLILNSMLNTLIFVIPVTILVSSLTYKLIELPFLNLKKFSLQLNIQNHGKF